MNIQDAMNILGLQGQVSLEEIKQAYRKAALQYHPDRNPAGLEMMKLVNAAYEALKNSPNGAESKTQNFNFGEKINTALNAIMGLGLTIEVCGCWVWVSGNTKNHKEILKTSGFKWAPKKMQWHFRPENKRCGRHATWSMNKIREVYGSANIKTADSRKLGNN